jgi:small subunit ribosomal protein S8
MNTQDPIGDMFTSIRNAQAVGKTNVFVPMSKIKMAILEVLLGEGYIQNFCEAADKEKSSIQIDLKYYEGEPVIEMIKRISRPGLRHYVNKESLPIVNGGLGVAIISTSQGIKTDKIARRLGLGGEVICYVS